MKISILLGQSLYGPYPHEQVMNFLDSGRLRETNLAWMPGMNDWSPLSTLFDSEFISSSSVRWEEEFNKIKKLIKKGEGAFALDLVDGLGEPLLYEKVLQNCCFGKDGSLHLSNLYTGFPGDTEYFFQFLAKAPRETRICSTLQSENFNSLKFENDSSIENLNFLESFTQLKSLEFSNCSNLFDFHSLSKLPALTSLKINKCNGLKDLSSFAGLEVSILEVNNCVNLTDISGLSSLSKISMLDLSGCSRIKDFSVLSELSNLESLILQGCDSIEDPKFFKSLSLENLELPGKFLPKLSYYETYSKTLTRYFYLTEEIIEYSPFDTLEDLIEAEEGDTEEWQEFLYDIRCGDYDEMDEYYGDNEYEDWEIILASM